MARKPKPRPVEENESFEVTVWDHEGDIVKKLWDATYEEAEEVQAQFEDDPFKTVVVERRD